MKTTLDIEDIDAISQRVLDLLRPLLADRGHAETVADDRHFNVTQLSEYIGMSAQWVYNNVKTLPHFNLNRKPLFRKSEIDAWMEQRRVKQEQDSAVARPLPVNQKDSGNVKSKGFRQR